MPERLIVSFCAPTMAGLKTASLFTADCESRSAILREITQMNRMLEGKGIRVMVLVYTKNRALIYMFRPKMLVKDLASPQTAEILASCGYRECSIGYCLSRLIRRLKDSSEFPHEIGCFLGYPPEDVAGFINRDKPCIMNGFWRVYGNADEAAKLFQKYRTCTDIFLRNLCAGQDMVRLTVTG